MIPMKAILKITSLTFLLSVITVICFGQQQAEAPAPMYDADGKVMVIQNLNMNISGLGTQQNIDELHKLLKGTAAFNITNLNTALTTGKSEIQYYDSPGTKHAIITAIEKQGYTVEVL